MLKYTLIPLLPFLSFLINILFGRNFIKDKAHWIAIFLKIAKHYKTVAVRLRLIFQFTYVQYCNIGLFRLVGHC